MKYSQASKGWFIEIMIIERYNSLRIHIPEGVYFSLLLAGPFSRFLAWLLDRVIIFATLMLLYSISGLSQFYGSGLFNAGMILVSFISIIGYNILFEWLWRGQTLGKRLLGIRVMDVLGLQLQFNQIVIRNLLRAVDSLPTLYLVGGTAMVLSERCQRLGDLAANTVVIYVPESMEPEIEQILSGKYNSLALYPHLEARLRHRTSSDEASILVKALLRRDLFNPEARIDLFDMLARHFEDKVSFPEESTEFLSDEQYLRNVADTLFRKTGSNNHNKKNNSTTQTAQVS